jgi:nucleoside-diphosphate-sugar epimerase
MKTQALERALESGVAMRVIITGATGFIGRALCKELHGSCEVIALSRDAESARQSLGDTAKVVPWMRGRRQAGTARLTVRWPL